MKIKCLVIDDEETARRGLAVLLEDYQEVELIGLCVNGVEAIDQIRALKPDLIFLDVQMPGVNGFEVLASLPKPWPQVVFITAHDQFALKAFEVNAVDYLLKPFSDERFDQALQRAKTKLKAQELENGAVKNLIDQTKASLKGTSSLIQNDVDQQRLVIKVDGSIHLLELPDIRYVEAFDYYVKIHVADRFFLLRETMKKMEERLPGSSFTRIHKSYIVNHAFVKALHRQENNEYEIELADSSQLKVSRNFRAQLLERLGV
jgi:two-component system, LytTR family, response regulator